MEEIKVKDTAATSGSKEGTKIDEGAIVNNDLNPLDAPVNEKSYSKPNVNTSDPLFTQTIPEPHFNAPPPRVTPPPAPEAKKPDPNPVNPELRDLGKKEKTFAAKKAAEMVLDGYSLLHQLANSTLKFNEKKLNKMHFAGEIDLNQQIPYEMGKTMKASEFVQEYNEQNKEALTVSEDFKEEVKPVLQRVLEKRGIGMTDEQTLLYMFGKDIAVKGVMWYSIRSTMKGIEELLKESLEATRAANAGQFNHNFQQAPPQNQQQQYQQQQEQASAQQQEDAARFYQQQADNFHTAPPQSSNNPETVKSDVIILEDIKKDVTEFTEPEETN